jgi:hypothetical protein
MRVNPKAVKKTASAEAAPAPKPKKEFAAVLKQGREAAPPPPLAQPPAKQAAPNPPKAPLPKPLQQETPRPQGPAKAESPAPAEQETPLAPVQGPEPQPQQFAPPVDAASEAAPAAPVVAIERIADEVLLIARPDGSHEIQAEVESKVMADLRISVTQRGDKIEVRLLTDTPATQRTLEQALPQLTQALQTRNLNPALVQVLPRAHTPSPTFAAPAEGRRQQQRDGG